MYNNLTTSDNTVQKFIFQKPIIKPSIFMIFLVSDWTGSQFIHIKREYPLAFS